MYFWNVLSQHFILQIPQGTNNSSHTVIVVCINTMWRLFIWIWFLPSFQRAEIHKHVNKENLQLNASLCLQVNLQFENACHCHYINADHCTIIVSFFNSATWDQTFIILTLSRFFSFSFIILRTLKLHLFNSIVVNKFIKNIFLCIKRRVEDGQPEPARRLHIYESFFIH